MSLNKNLLGPGFLVLGALFGFLLSRAGATTYDFYAQLFLFQNFQLLWVIAVAAGLGALVHSLVRYRKSASPKAILTNAPLSYKGKPYVKSLVPGSLIFGLGWGLAGACPGTALAMLGEGKLGSLWTLGGFFVGTLVFGLKENYRINKFIPAQS
jgi:uncharacterized membrane protein YedE/YeeE